MKLVFALLGVACQGATITSTSSYSQTFGADGPLNISIYAPRFDPTLGTLTSFSIRGVVGIQADLAIQMGYLSGDFDITAGMQVKLKWGSIPNYGLAVITGTPTHIADTSRGDLYQIPNAINGSTAIGTACGVVFVLCSGALPDAQDYRFSLRFLPVWEFNRPSTRSFTGTMTADFTATYDYTPVTRNPEPATGAMAVIPMLALLYRHHRRS